MSDYKVTCEECDEEVNVDLDDVVSELSAECECGNTLGIELSPGGTLVTDSCESCKQDNYDEGYSDGKDEGYDNGYDEGYNEGESEAEICEEGGSEPSPDEIARIKDLGYEEGYADAQKEFNAIT